MSKPSQAALRAAKQCRDFDLNPTSTENSITVHARLIDAEFADAVAALRAWQECFTALDRISEPTDPLVIARKQYHGTRLEMTRAALARHDGGN